MTNYRRQPYYRHALKVRRAVEALVKNFPLSFDAEDLTGACALASIILARQLEKHNISARFVMGQYHNKKRYWDDHCWVETDDVIIDVTATQFSKKLPKVYVTDVCNKRYVVIEYDQPAIHFIENEWPISQGIAVYEPSMERLLEHVA